MCGSFLGVNKYTLNAVVRGDMGVQVPWQHQHVEVATQWRKFNTMANDIVNKQVFTSIQNLNCKNWVTKPQGSLDHQTSSPECQCDTIHVKAIHLRLQQLIEHLNM